MKFVMGKNNPNLHIICGKCGCRTMLSFEFCLDGTDNGEYVYPAVYIHCDNCGTLTSLDEEIKDKTDWLKLNLIKGNED